MPSFRLLFVLLGLALLAGAGAVAGADGDAGRVGEGEPLVQFWSPRDYGGLTECPAFTQDARGVMYVGSRSFLLEYDGATWRQVPIPNSAYVAGLAYDAPTDTVFVGVADDLGYLRTAPGGAHTFVSLRDRLPEGERDGGEFYGVYATAQGVYFVGTDRVLRWRNGGFQTWRFTTTDHLRSAWAAGRLYVSSPQVGLRRLEGEEFVSVCDDAVLRRAKVGAILPGEDGSLLVATIREGMFTLRDGVLRPLPCECDPFFKEHGLVKLVRLRDGGFAASTDEGELVLLDPARRFRSRADRFGGGRAGEIYNLFEDAEGGVWIGMQIGVARAEPGSALSVLRARPDDNLSSTFALAPLNGTLVVGNNSGVFRVAPADPAAAAGAHLEWVPGTTRSSYGMAAAAGGVLFLRDADMMFLDAAGRVAPAGEGLPEANSTVASRVRPGRVYVIDQGGQVCGLRRDAATGRWVRDGFRVELGFSATFTMAESARGDLWVGTDTHGLFRVAISPEDAPGVVSFFDAPGPLHGAANVAVAAAQGQIFVSEDNRGLWRFDEGAQTLVPLTAFGQEFADGSTVLGEYAFVDARSLWLTYQRGSEEGHREAFCGRVLAGGGPGGAAPVFQSVSRQVEAAVGAVDAFLPVEEAAGPRRAVLLVGSTGNALVRLDVARWEKELAAGPRPFAALIRRAFTTGAGGDAAGESPIGREPLEYGRNTAHFEYAPGTMAFGAAPKFQTRLAGFGAGEWSAWSERASVDYLNLPEGRYTFEVRARNADGQTGAVAPMGFRVLPPWQRSAWAYALYALAAAAAVAGFVRWRGRQLRRRNVALAALVDARTAELRGREAELLANEQALVRARDDAESANRAKSAFLANMSHELRTPLNAVLGYAQLLLKQPDLTARSREQATVIGQSGGHLLSLVNEVLDLSKVEAGKLTLAPFDFPLGQLLDEVSAAFRPRLAEKHLTYTETRAAGLPHTVRTDPSRLRQVLFNLLSNAVKFTSAGGVTLTVRPTEDKGGRVRFEVADTGVGIAPQDQRDIFLAFYQTGERHLASQGTGLGLTISQRLVELLGGRIELESSPGAGSRFWFELPLFNVEAAGRPSTGVLPASVLGDVQGYEEATRRLLLVDDLAENRRVLRDFLQPLGFEIEEAADGPSALAACTRAMPDAVLLDLRLGAMDGFAVARALRVGQKDGSKRPGIIAISASVFESDRQQALDASCDDFLPKPFEEAQLLATLGRVLGLRWVQQMPAPAGPLANGATLLPAEEIDTLRKLSRRGDTVGIRRHLDAWRADGDSARTGELARRLEVLLAAYDLDGIDALLVSLQSSSAHADAHAPN